MKIIKIHCAQCGKLYEANVYAGWIEPSSHTRICSKECHAELQKRWYSSLLARDTTPVARDI